MIEIEVEAPMESAEYQSDNHSDNPMQAIGAERLISARLIAAFLGRVSQSASRALLLDYDGTLAGFRVDPALATPYPGIQALLRRIQTTTDTRLVLVTGRRAQDIVRLLGLKHLEIWGCHGLERLMADGTHQLPEIDAQGLAAISEADDLLAAEGIADLAEVKPGGIAIHWRGREPLAAEVTEKVQRIWSMLRHREQLRLVAFDGGMEIRVDAGDKGDVVRTLLSEMDSETAVAYLGDDATDEDAFAALRGRGLNILVRGKYRPTLADAWISPPEEVVTFLKDWIAACGGAA